MQELPEGVHGGLEVGVDEIERDGIRIGGVLGRRRRRLLLGPCVRQRTEDQREGKEPAEGLRQRGPGRTGFESHIRQ